MGTGEGFWRGEGIPVPTSGLVKTRVRFYCDRCSRGWVSSVW